MRSSLAASITVLFWAFSSLAGAAPHRASPPGAPPSSNYRRVRPRVRVRVGIPPPYFGYRLRYRAYPVYPTYSAPVPPPPSTQDIQEEWEPREAYAPPSAAPRPGGSLLAELTADGRSGALGVIAQGEGERVGATIGLFGYSRPRLYATPGLSNFGTFNGDLTFSLISTEHLRWRLLGGFDSAFMSSLWMLGPHVGTSFTAHLTGPLGFEASADFTPVPFQKADFRAGLWLNVGAFVARVGWRTMYFSDSFTQVLSGPSLAVGVAF